QDVQHQRDLRFFRKPGMAAGEHHAQLIVFDRVCSEKLRDDGSDSPFAIEPSLQLAREGARVACATQHIERALLCGGNEPRGGFSGTPRNFHTSSARQKASCTTSSANARFWTPKMRVNVATMRPASRRNKWSL